MPVTKKKTTSKVKSYTAFPLTQNNHRFFFTTIPVSELYQYCFVSRREEDPELGFQRTLNGSRSEDIAKYLSRGDGSIPTNIVLSAQDIASVKYSARSKTINFSRKERSFLVLDGQHRLLGYHICSDKYGLDHRVPVAIYTGLSRSEEAKLFIDINTTQRGVSAALLLDIKQVADIESQLEEELREVFSKLSDDPKSPMAGRLIKGKSARGKISQVTFNRAFQSAYRSGFMADMATHSRYKLIVNYLSSFEAELEDEELLVRSAFFEAVIDIMDEVVRASLSIHKDAKKQSIQKVIRPIAKIDYESVVTGGKSRITKSTFAELMKSALRKNVKITDNIL